jgi:hypothetical protein
MADHSESSAKFEDLTCLCRLENLPALLSDFAQTVEGRPRQYPRMHDSLWYRQKADECARLAKDASEPHRRRAHETQERLWLRIADQIEANEDAARSAR